MIQVADKRQHLINLMKDQSFDYDITEIDVTTLQVLIEKKLPQEKSQINCITGWGLSGKEESLYEYNVPHSSF